VVESTGRHRRVSTDGRGVALHRLLRARLLRARALRTVAPTVLVAVSLVACTTSSAPPAPPTARVQRGNVTTAVSSSGSLTALTEQNLGFVKGGQLTTVQVTVGQRVTRGQIVATVDDAAARRTLEQQQAQLDSQRAVLTRLTNSTAVQGATNSTEQANAILEAQQDQAAAVVDADESAIDRAESQLDFDEDARDDAEDRLDDAEDACDATGGSSSGSNSGSSSGSGSSAASASSSSDLLAALGTLAEDGDGDDGDEDESKKVKEARKKLEAAVKAAGGLAGSLAAQPGTAAGSANAANTANTANSACAQVAPAQQAADAANRQVEASQTALDAARNRRDVDEAAGRLAIENARQGVVTAQNNLDAATTDRPSLLAQQAALVRAAEATVRQAQRDVDDTVLRAPVDGTVAAVNGAVGEFLTAGSGTTALAPGSDASIPGTGSTTGGGAQAAAGTTGSVSRPGGSNFVVLNNVDRFQVVVPFEEADATRIAPNQRVDVRFDAIPDLTRAGTVVSVSPSAVSLSGVISYYVTVALNETDARLRNGLTTQAAVVTEELRDVLVVPSAAVRRQGNQSTVTVLGPTGPRIVPFQPGAVGDDTTQVLSGLTAGDEVVVGTGR
jgi:HlyD family secretion protein